MPESAPLHFPFSTWPCLSSETDAYLIFRKKPSCCYASGHRAGPENRRQWNKKSLLSAPSHHSAGRPPALLDSGGEGLHSYHSQVSGCIWICGLMAYFYPPAAFGHAARLRCSWTLLSKKSLGGTDVCSSGTSRDSGVDFHTRQHHKRWLVCRQHNMDHCENQAWRAEGEGDYEPASKGHRQEAGVKTNAGQTFPFPCRPGSSTFLML